MVVASLIATALVAILPCASARADLLTRDHGIDGPIPSAPIELEFLIQTDKGIYEVGERVHITYRIANPHDVRIIHETNAGPPFSVAAAREGETVWWSSAGFWLAFERVTFDPGRVIETEYWWEMVDMAGNRLPPGPYDVVGLSGMSPEVRTSITIVPEPGTLFLLGSGLAAALGLRRGKSLRASTRFCCSPCW